jgi:ABC-type phosphate transport system permease subunit
MSAVSIIGLYFVVGLAAIMILDALTGRVRHRIKESSADAQLIIMNQVKAPISIKASLFVTLIALWVWWPFAIGSAIFGLIHKEAHDDKK